MSIDNNSMSVFLEGLSDILGENSTNQFNSQDFESVPLSQNECIHVVDFNKNELVFNKGFENLLGYSKDEISIEFIESLYHPKDAIIVNRIIRASILYCFDYPRDSIDSELFISFRLRKKDGNYIKVLSRSSTLEVDKSNRITSTLIKFTDISFMDVTENVNWNFKAKSLNETAFREELYENYQKIFTKRELEIIKEIKNGYTNKQIAKNLNISEHTVTTHRKNIFKKCDCHNLKELISFSKGIGVL